MQRINGQTAQNATTKKRAYALRRMGIALDRVVAAETETQRKKAAKWSTLWLKHWNRLLAEIKQARDDIDGGFNQKRRG
jgi:hypothetical protein